MLWLFRAAAVARNVSALAVRVTATVQVAHHGFPLGFQAGATMLLLSGLNAVERDEFTVSHPDTSLATNV
jgi:hypothetical protein